MQRLKDAVYEWIRWNQDIIQIVLLLAAGAGIGLLFMGLHYGYILGN